MYDYKSVHERTNERARRFNTFADLSLQNPATINKSARRRWKFAISSNWLSGAFITLLLVSVHRVVWGWWSALSLLDDSSACNMWIISARDLTFYLFAYLIIFWGELRIKFNTQDHRETSLVTFFDICSVGWLDGSCRHHRTARYLL